VSALITNHNFQARGVDIHVVGNLGVGGVDSELGGGKRVCLVGGRRG
jgi:hypothetical protein